MTAVAVWFNASYVWDPNAGVIPACWPRHPPLVWEVATLADQRRRAGIATSSDQLEDWHRHCVLHLPERLRVRARPPGDDGHAPWPARGRHTATRVRRRRRRSDAYTRDVASLTRLWLRIEERHQVLQPTFRVVETDAGG